MTFSSFFISALIILGLSLKCTSFHQYKPNNIVSKSVANLKAAISTNKCKSLLLGLGIFSVTQLTSLDNSFLAANALDDMTVVSNDVTAVAKISSKPVLSEEERVKRKLELQNKASKNSNINSYSDSLQREKQKQEGMKKSKVARSQDLCEVLGRGC